MTATNTIYPLKNEDRENLVTLISGCGELRKQLDYVQIYKNIETWINYSKAKGTANNNKTPNAT